MAGAMNSADLFTKEDNDVKHYETLQDQMVMPQEPFALSPSSIKNKNIVLTTTIKINSNPDTLLEGVKTKVGCSRFWGIDSID